MAFQYWTGAAWANIPDAALGSTHEGGTFVLEYPRANERDGDGDPCGAVGNPRIVMRTPRMTGTGMAHWTGQFGAITDEYATYDQEIYNERDASTDKMTGNLLWPRFSRVFVGSTAAKTMFYDVEIVIENCTTSSN
jgi:hypothetical protein